MTKGQRRPDLAWPDLHSDVRPGDYWKILNRDGTPRIVHAEGKLTESTWYVAVPVGDANGFLLGRLDLHTVREHEDGTISVAPGDGNSNSIQISNHKWSWHGYIDHGVFQG